MDFHQSYLFQNKEHQDFDQSYLLQIQEFAPHSGIPKFSPKSDWSHSSLSFSFLALFSLQKKNGPLQKWSHTFFFNSEWGLSVCSGPFFRGMWGVLLFLILFMIISLNFEYEYVFLIIPKTTVKTLARLLELQRQLLFFVTWLTKGRLQQEFYSHLCLDQWHSIEITACPIGTKIFWMKRCIQQFVLMSLNKKWTDFLMQ